MTSQDLIRQLFLRLNKFKWIIILGGILFGALLYLYAKQKPVMYSVRSTVFPLTGGGESSSSSKLSELIGGGSGAKNLSEEATISIEEVAKSRKTREAVVAEKVPDLQNKMIATLLIETYNKNRGFLKPAIEMPASESSVISIGAALLGDPATYSAKFNKNGLLEINFSSADQRIVSPVSYALVDKISLFYKELKIKKAKFDFDFTEKKVDSLQQILNTYDRQQIRLNNTTLFVPADRLEYSIPKENLQGNKMRVLGQRNGAAANREDALWRLQKVTPIIEILDRPEPPFGQVQPSKLIYGVGGFILGLVIFTLIFVSSIIYRFLNRQLHQTIFSTGTSSVTTTA